MTTPYPPQSGGRPPQQQFSTPPYAGMPYPQAGYPGGPPEPRGSRRLILLFASIGLAALIGSGITLVVAWPKLTGSSNGSSGGSTGGGGDDRAITISMPDSTAGYTKSADSSTTATLQKSLSASLKDPVTAAYTKSSEPTKPVIAMGAKTTVTSIGSNLDQFFTSFAKSSKGTVTDRTSVTPPSSVGGQMECATISASGASFGVCTWANHSGMVATMCLGLTESEAGDLTKKMLPDIVHSA